MLNNSSRTSGGPSRLCDCLSSKVFLIPPDRDPTCRGCLRITWEDPCNSIWQIRPHQTLVAGEWFVTGFVNVAESNLTSINPPRNSGYFHPMQWMWNWRGNTQVRVTDVLLCYHPIVRNSRQQQAVPMLLLLHMIV